MYEYNYASENAERMSARAYNITIGLILLWGFGINALMCKFCTEIFMSWNFTVVIIAYFVVALLGIWMSMSSSNPIVSFIGYNLVVLPVGMVLSIALTGYDQISIMNALLTTIGVTVLMIVLASVNPNIFLSMGKVLLICLTGVVICEVIFMLIGIMTPSIWDFFVAVLFCCYIGYDWAEAQDKPYTIDNAIDSVVSLYLDIINLFMRVLSSSSKSSNSR